MSNTELEFEAKKLALIEKLKYGRPTEECIEPYNVSKVCLNPEHTPARFVVRKPGKYRHTCPGCHKETIFEVPLVTC